MIDVKELTVQFGGVVPIDRMTLTFPGGTCGLIGPNGAGKTTFFNVLSGFVRPMSGMVTAFGDDVLAMPDFKRARWGVRRTSGNAPDPAQFPGSRYAGNDLHRVRQHGQRRHARTTPSPVQ